MKNLGLLGLICSAVLMSGMKFSMENGSIGGDAEIFIFDSGINVEGGESYSFYLPTFLILRPELTLKHDQLLLEFSARLPLTPLEEKRNGNFWSTGTVLHIPVHQDGYFLRIDGEYTFLSGEAISPTEIIPVKNNRFSSVAVLEVDPEKEFSAFAGFKYAWYQSPAVRVDVGGSQYSPSVVSRLLSETTEQDANILFGIHSQGRKGSFLWEFGFATSLGFTFVDDQTTRQAVSNSGFSMGFGGDIFMGVLLFDSYPYRGIFGIGFAGTYHRFDVGPGNIETNKTGHVVNFHRGPNVSWEDISYAPFLRLGARF